MTRAEAIARLTARGQPYELVADEREGVTRKRFANAPATLRELFLEACSDKTFFVYDEQRLTFTEAYALSARVAQMLQDRFGVRKGDRVAIAMRNYPEWVIAFNAATSIGAIAVAMNALWQSEEMEYGLRDCGAKVLFADQERLDRLAGRAEGLGCQVVSVRTPPAPGVRSLGELLEGIEAQAMPAADIAPDDPATIFYTSGSTGHPKGVVSSHRAIITALMSWELDAQAVAMVSSVEPPPPASQPATLLAVPLFHVTGSHAVFLQSYRAQRKVVSMYKWDPALAAELIERERISSVTAPAAMTGDLVRVAKATSRDLSSLMTVGGGGAPRAPEQVHQIAAAFEAAAPNTGWGMTETNAIGTGIGGNDYLVRPASSGRCSPVLELKIVDESGSVLPPGERGELLVRGTSLFSHYWNRPDATSAAFLESGWFRTGDVAYLDDEGYLFIVDRSKDLIIRGGENIGCGLVEAALLTHPGVHEAAVYAVPDERLGEEVGATVYGEADLDPDQLLAHVAPRLAAFARPRYLRISPTPLPRTASGKILKRQIRDEAVAAMAR